MSILRILAGVGIALAAAAAAPDSAFDSVVAALADGSAAHTAAGRERAAMVLASAAARPADGGADLVLRWQGKRPATLYRNRALGPAYRAIGLAAGGSAAFDQTFLAGQIARVAVVALDTSRAAPPRVSVAVTDDDGAPQCHGAATPRCDWVPLWTSRYHIALHNGSDATGKYYLVVQ